MSPNEAQVKLDRVSEGVAAGRRVRLPRGAEPPIRVYVNGVEQSEGVGLPDSTRRDRLRATDRQGGKGERMRWLAMLLGLFGTYRKHETVDVEYRLGGR